jgi:hypothetical protein
MGKRGDLVNRVGRDRFDRRGFRSDGFSELLLEMLLEVENGSSTDRIASRTTAFTDETGRQECCCERSNVFIVLRSEEGAVGIDWCVRRIDGSVCRADGAIRRRGWQGEAVEEVPG